MAVHFAEINKQAEGLFGQLEATIGLSRAGRGESAEHNMTRPAAPDKPGDRPFPPTWTQIADVLQSASHR